MKYRKTNYSELFLWSGIGGLALLYLIEKSKSEAQSVDNDIIIKENFKYNPIYNSNEFGGNPFASNTKGSGKFNYLGIEQAKEDFGLECYSASVVNIFKSLGIIEP